MRELPFFFKEALKSLRIHPAANAVSVLSIALAILSLGLVIGGWANLEHALEVTRAEAEIVVYLAEDMDVSGAEALGERLIAEGGATRVRTVAPEETVDRVQALLGPDFDILEILEGFNPFSPSLEVGVDPEEAQAVAGFARGLPGVDLVRDNEEILAPLAALARAARWIGLAASVGVAFVTLILVSHIVRLGISARREEIETLRLLGASEWFVSLPFLLEGGMLGGLGAVVCLAVLLPGGPALYRLLGGYMPFMPLLAWGQLASILAYLSAGIGLVAGTLGAFVALRSQ